MPLYTLELDLELHFDPPMDDRGPGIVLTRTISLPFPPTDKLILYSSKMDECPEPGGWCLTDLTYDIERDVFLARTFGSYGGFFFREILDVLRAHVERGWRFGSYLDKYRQPEPVQDEDQAWVPWDQVGCERDEVPGKSARTRSREFNRLFGGLVGAMASLRNNLAVAFAMDKTKRFFDSDELKDDSPAVKKWVAACDEYQSMKEDARERWREAAEKRYRSLQRLVCDPPTM